MEKTKNNQNNHIEEIRNFFKKNSAKSYPVKGHPLARQEEYIRNRYLDMLCTVAQYENTDTENALRFIQRISAGCGDTMDIQDHIRRSMELSVESVAEFVQQCKECKLAEMYIADSLLLIYGNGVPDRKRLEYVSETADALGINREKIEYISSMVAGVLRQRTDVDIHISKKLNAADRVRIAEEIHCYMSEYSIVPAERFIAQKGDILKFGNFNGKVIEWIVLKREDDQLFLLCKESLCKKRYDGTSNSWKSSELHHWLNSAFYKEAFGRDEKELILQKDGDNITLLTEEEAKSMMHKSERGLPGNAWWLRSPGNYNFEAVVVASDGAFDIINVNNFGYAVRPALWINLKS